MRLPVVPWGEENGKPSPIMGQTARFSVFSIQLPNLVVDLLFSLQPVVDVLTVLAPSRLVEFEGTGRNSVKALIAEVLFRDRQ